MALNKIINWGIFLLLTFIWGSSFILMKHSKEELTASQIASLRIFTAGLVFLPFAVVHIFKIPRKKLGFVILSALTGNLIPAFLYAIAIAKGIDSALASILNSLTPLCVVVIAITAFKDKIQTRKIIGILIGLGGLILLFLLWKGISFDNIKYASLILGATICYGFNVNMVAHFLKDIRPLHIATVSLAFMIIPTAIILWYDDFMQLPFYEEAVQFALVEVGMLGIAGSAIATLIFYVLIKRAGTIFTSLVTYSIPFVGIFWGVIDGENITWQQIICLAIILTGVYVVNKKDDK